MLADTCTPLKLAFESQEPNGWGDQPWSPGPEGEPSVPSPTVTVQWRAEFRNSNAKLMVGIRWEEELDHEDDDAIRATKPLLDEPEPPPTPQPGQWLALVDGGGLG